MKLEEDLKKLCKQCGDIEIVSVDSFQKTAEVLLPYESSSVVIELEGDTMKEKIESFRQEVNQQLERMIDHLGDCKF